MFAMGGGAYAITSIPGANGVIHGCYQKKTGILRVVAARSRCSRSEQPIAWNQQGPNGAKGNTGPAIGPAGGDLAGNYPNPTLRQPTLTGVVDWRRRGGRGHFPNPGAPFPTQSGADVVA